MHIILQNINIIILRNLSKKSKKKILNLDKQAPPKSVQHTLRNIIL